MTQVPLILVHKPLHGSPVTQPSPPPALPWQGKLRYNFRSLSLASPPAPKHKHRDKGVMEF